MLQRDSTSKRNNLLTGIILGTIVPIIAYYIFYFIRDQLVYQGVMPQEWAASDSSDRTLGIVAICANIFVIQYFNRRRYTNAMRGLVFPTILFCGLWFYFYGIHLIKQI